MIRTFLAAALAVAVLAGPAAAQEGAQWRHQASGVSLPRDIGDLRLRGERDASGGGNWDVILQYGDERNPVTVYVYRSAFPNPALWFERTRLAMNANVGSDRNAVDPRTVTVGGGAAPNGLREDIALPSGGFRATSVTIAQAGQWLVKVRVSSADLDLPGVSARMDRVLAALRFANASAPHPLRLPPPCGDDNRMSRQAMVVADEALLAAALPALLSSEAEARGEGGLAADPAAWCRDTTEVPVEYATVYRARNGSGWVALLADSGRAVTGAQIDLPDMPRTGRAAVLANTPAGTSLVSLFAALPHPDIGAIVGIPVAAGAAEGLMSIGQGEPARAPPKN